jgi:glucose-6-phosphate 1-dehydrogenase
MSADERTDPKILVIFGISGDLSQRKLIPAIREIALAGALPSEFRLVGITRKTADLQGILASLENIESLKGKTSIFQMDLSDLTAYDRLDAHLAELASGMSRPPERIYYLSIPPHASRPVIEMIGSSHLAKYAETKILLEKPFGVDLASATEITESVARYFKEEQVYRIDHYLAKEMAQNLLTFRRANSLFKKTWNADFIESLDVIATESIGIEGRAVFYEQTGALRDVLQSHLLQLAALVLMDLPEEHDWNSVGPLRAKALQALRVPTRAEIGSYVIRGQYEGYGQDAKNPESTVETFVSMTLESSDPKWRGVPIRLSTGKALSEKLTEIRVRYKQEASFESNELRLRIQPNEGVSMGMWAKRPGYDDALEPHAISFLYGEHYATLPDAYERVIVDAMRGKRSFFLSSEEVIASWKVVDPVQRHWALSNEPLRIYTQGTDLKTLVETAE